MTSEPRTPNDARPEPAPVDLLEALLQSLQTERQARPDTNRGDPMSTDTTANGLSATDSDQQGADMETGSRTGAEAQNATQRHVVPPDLMRRIRLLDNFDVMAHEAWTEERADDHTPRTVAPEAERTLDKLLGWRG